MTTIAVQQNRSAQKLGTTKELATPDTASSINHSHQDPFVVVRNYRQRKLHKIRHELPTAESLEVKQGSDTKAAVDFEAAKQRGTENDAVSEKDEFQSPRWRQVEEEFGLHLSQSTSWLHQNYLNGGVDIKDPSIKTFQLWNPESE